MLKTSLSTILFFSLFSCLSVACGAADDSRPAELEADTGSTWADDGAVVEGEDELPAECDEGASIKCKVLLGQNGTQSNCFVGEKVCENGTWSECR